MSGDAVSETAHYDVPERRLALVGATLSRRLERGQGIWRVELPRPEAAPHVVEEQGGPVTPPHEVAALLPAFLRGGGVERVDPSADGEPATADDAVGRLRQMLARQYAEILLHDAGVRLDLDPEDVHKVRVAARRARAVLRAARPMLDPSWSEPLRNELHWLGGSLGRRRDVDVLVAHLQREVKTLEQPERTAATALVGVLVEERETAQAIALDALRSERYYGLLDALEAAARGPRVRTGRVSLRELAQREFRRLHKIAERLAPDASDDDLHRMRIAGKRASVPDDPAATRVEVGG